MTEGYAAYRKRKASEESQVGHVCAWAKCGGALPPGSRRGRMYCSESCKNAAFEASRQPRPKRMRAEYHKQYKRVQRAEAARKAKNAKDSPL